MKKMWFSVLLVLTSASVFALEARDLLNMKVPSDLERNQLLIQIQHRFYGTLNDPTMGMANGANDGLGLRYPVLSRLEVNGNFVISREEFTLGGSYAYYLRPAFIRTQVDVQYFNFKDNLLPQRKGGFFGLLSFESEPILKIFTPVVNLGYDGFNRKVGLGAGLAAQVKLDKPPFKSFGIIGEFFPVVEKDSMNTGLKNCFAVGLKFETWGHHFIFMVGNSSEIGTRYWMQGAPDNGLHLGFNINRMVDI